ncbi:hypothetical protein B0I35DRAFT_483307 [Stachybotrys elegans]|uniref:Uncharacterized protein n=1 Tax=Stachybotrys elegans TaxID=80388 RepID=A0A8K0WKZ3_9HYPO|nr:hypothetical protein B0I35DRAFT_483307 [Stachybotrys elegans]
MNTAGHSTNAAAVREGIKILKVEIDVAMLNRKDVDPSHWMVPCGFLFGPAATFGILGFLGLESPPKSLADSLSKERFWQPCNSIATRESHPAEY